MRKRLGQWFLRLIGWRVVGAKPPWPKFVAVVAPHTSNWDFPIGLALSWVLELRAGFVAKEGLFRPPLGWLLRALGGRPVQRDRHENLVDEIAQVFISSDRFVLAITPEGTRSRVDEWKSGFYHVAALANVPIVPVYVDYATKTAGVGPALFLTGDVGTDMDVLREFYAGRQGKRPQQFGVIRLGSEAGP